NTIHYKSNPLSVITMPHCVLQVSLHLSVRTIVVWDVVVRVSTDPYHIEVVLDIVVRKDVRREWSGAAPGEVVLSPRQRNFAIGEVDPLERETIGGIHPPCDGPRAVAVVV